MDPAWIALLGATVGALGATGAATVTGWSARRQAANQASSQHSQWQREKRRDAYSTFLDAGVQARDALTDIWRLLKMPDTRDRDMAVEMKSAVEFVDSVRRASATNFVEGPDLILLPTRRAEESIVLFHAVLKATIKDLGAGRDVEQRLRMCASQEAHVRDVLDRFAAAAREVLEGCKQRSDLMKDIPARASQDKLALLVGLLSERLGIGVDEIDIKRPIFETGLDSLGFLEILNKINRQYASLPDSLPISSLLFTQSIENIAGYIAAQRRSAD